MKPYYSDFANLQWSQRYWISIWSCRAHRVQPWKTMGLGWLGTWRPLGQVWKTYSDLFNICSGGQILPITIPLKLNSSIPWKHKMNKSRLFCFSVCLLGTSVICLSSYFYCSEATPALVHGKLHWHSVSCLSAGKDMPSGQGRVVGRTKVSGISPDQITSHSISYTEKVAMENLCKALNAFREISVLHNCFLI